MADTFGSKLAKMREDLESIVTRMNKDKSFAVAQAAQVAICAVADLEDQLEQAYGTPENLAWDWKPGDG